MSLKIIKAGLLDTLQDEGRCGYQHLGINPGGAMDRFSARLANALLGKDLSAPVLELHFPAATILFEEAAIICLTGAHFVPTVEGEELPLNQPVALTKGTLLEFKGYKKGARCYLALLPDLEVLQWLHSYSTNVKAGAGGWQGRPLQSGDVLSFRHAIRFPIGAGSSLTKLPWKAVQEVGEKSQIQFIQGPEWHWLTDEAKELFQKDTFQVAMSADRMGYRLIGKVLEVKEKSSLVSSAVTLGTVQLLPNGQLIVLMADHQTTGGYPKIAHVISADLPLLAQRQPMERITFKMTDLQSAENKIVTQQKYLQHLQTACKLKMENIL